MVVGAPLSRADRPSTAGSALKRRCQYAQRSRRARRLGTIIVGLQQTAERRPQTERREKAADEILRVDGFECVSTTSDCSRAGDTPMRLENACAWSRKCVVLRRKRVRARRIQLGKPADRLDQFLGRLHRQRS